MPNEAIPASMWRDDAESLAEDAADELFNRSGVATDRYKTLKRAADACEKLAALTEHEEKRPPMRTERKQMWNHVWVEQRNRIIADLLRGPTP